MLSGATLAWAGELPKPVGKPILTIYGNIENTNEEEKQCLISPALKN
jgi:hypothetical protein